MYDVFVNIADDEAEHVKTMASCQDPSVIVRSPNTEAAVLATTALTAVAVKLISDSRVQEIDASEVGYKLPEIANQLSASMSQMASFCMRK